MIVKKKISIWALTVALSTLGGILHAQSVSFSQFYASRMYLNPAFTGIEQGTSANVAYREQWGKVPGRLRTVFAAVDMGCGYDGLGVSFFSNSEGEGFLNTTEVSAYYGRTVPMKISGRRRRLSGGRANFNLHLGARVGWANKRVDWPRLIFSDQLHPVLGVVAAQSPGAVPILQSHSYFDHAFGIAVRFDVAGKFRKKEEQKIRGQFGFAVSNPFQPNESLQQLTTLLPRKYTVHGGLMVPVLGGSRSGTPLKLVPNFKFDFQGGINSLTYGMYATYDRFFLGAFYQNTYLTFDPANTNAVIFTAGVRIEDDASYYCDLAYSYDANPTGLSMRSAGVHEFTLRANFKDACLLKKIGTKRRAKNVLNCRRFF
jgi:type IX secretion system PorP/SprF family membrane protein